MKAIITVLGRDNVGIVASVAARLAEKCVNILEISQTIIGGYFDMLMIVDISKMNCTPAEIAADMEKLSAELGLKIQFQRTEIFEAMHRI
ncbi:MAG: ACT domain-containing protein [Synergistaceae bacterium]|nr:ACT domain-containing protein [Candidatus Equadaptatus faecalis]